VDPDRELIDVDLAALEASTRHLERIHDGDIAAVHATTGLTQSTSFTTWRYGTMMSAC
jgi:hypothetical protein